MDHALKEELRQSLQDEKERLEKELGSFAQKDPHMPDDWDTKFPTPEAGASSSHSQLEEQADLVEEFESEIAQEHSLESRLREVAVALERIDAPQFGICQACGQEIPAERLRANPAAAYDIDHQPTD